MRITAVPVLRYINIMQLRPEMQQEKKFMRNIKCGIWGCQGDKTGMTRACDAEYNGMIVTSSN